MILFLVTSQIRFLGTSRIAESNNSGEYAESVKVTGDDGEAKVDAPSGYGGNLHALDGVRKGGRRAHLALLEYVKKNLQAATDETL